MKQNHAAHWVPLLLAVWCVLFLRCESTEQSMIRLVMLEKDAQGWTAGLVYQSPEASADSSEAQVELRFSAAEGESLAKALAQAEKALPQKPNYRLCDYLLLTPGVRPEQLAEYEQLVLAQQCGRVAARMLYGAFDCAEFSEQSEETQALPEKLLQRVRESARDAPSLYDRRSGLLLPVIELTAEGVGIRSDGIFLSEQGEQPLDAAQTAAAQFLTGKSGVYTFWLEGEKITLRCRSRAVQPERDGSFTLRLTCQNAAGSQPPDEAQRAELEALCTRTAEEFWSRGADLMGLSASLALQKGSDNVLLPAKNACPELRTDVEMLFDF